MDMPNKNNSCPDNPEEEMHLTADQLPTKEEILFTDKQLHTKEEMHLTEDQLPTEEEILFTEKQQPTGKKMHLTEDQQPKKGMFTLLMPFHSTDIVCR